SNLWQHDEGKAIGLSYFKERGFSEVVINAFDLGYSLEGWDFLLKDAEKKGYNPDILEQAGLIIRTEGKTYDRFRGRAIFPIHNNTGKTIAFGARILKADKKQPKYLNSPETEVYHKSKTLYGLFQAKQSIRLQDNCYVVEGYTDVISMHLSGVENVVSSSGTSLTEDQIKIISRYTKNITVLFDGDVAGIKASLRGIDMILESGLNVRAITFPDGEDPDSYSRKLGTAAFQNFLKENARDFITFKTLLFTEQAANDPIKKAETIKEIIGTIAKVADPVQRAVYIKECSSLLSIDEGILISELNKVHIKKKKEAGSVGKAEEKFFEESPLRVGEELVKEQKLNHEEVIVLQERESIRLLISYALNKFEEKYHIYDYLLSELEDIEFHTPVYKEILHQFKTQLNQGNIADSDYFIRNGSEEVRNAVIDLISQKYDISINWKNKFQIMIPRETDVLHIVVLTNILRLNFRIIQKLISENMAALKKAESQEDQEKYIRIHSELKKSEMEIANKLGIVVNK
ncbi:MAG: DNA primase, partial [Bacteroidota bacterium]|nr:DNA primase [Bacteroidota bacterium]